MLHELHRKVMMKFQQINAFKAVIELGTVTAAANYLQTFRSEEVLQRVAIQICDIGFALAAEAGDGMRTRPLPKSAKTAPATRCGKNTLTKTFSASKPAGRPLGNAGPVL